MGTAVTDEQYAAIAAGTFDGLYIGDFWTINGINYRIAAFNYYINKGDAAPNINHVTIVPDTMGYDYAMNDANTTVGGYADSKMRNEGLTQAKELIFAAFGENHILSHRKYFTNATTNGHASSGDWYDSAVDLMSEENVFGHRVYGNLLNDENTLPDLFSLDNVQYPIFRYGFMLITGRKNYWLRDVVSNTNFARVSNTGAATSSPATTAATVRPAFSICSEQ